MGSCTSKQDVKDTKTPEISNSVPQKTVHVTKSKVQLSTSTEDLAHFPEFSYFDRDKSSVVEISKDKVTEIPIKSTFNFPTDSAMSILPNGNVLSAGGIIKNSLVRIFFSIDIQTKVVTELTSLPWPSKLGQLHLIGDWVYYIGGIKNSVKNLEQAPLLRFNHSLGKWEDLWRYGEQFQFDRIINMGTCALGNKLFLVGGQKITSTGSIVNNKKIYSISVEESFKVQVEGKIPFKVLNPIIANGRKNAVVTGGTKPKTLEPNRGSFFIIAHNEGVKIIKISDIGIDLTEKYPGVYEKDTAIFISRPYVVIRTKKINKWIGYEVSGKESIKCLVFKNENRPEDLSSDDSCGIEKASRLNLIGERQVSNEIIVKYSSVNSPSLKNQKLAEDEGSENKVDIFKKEFKRKPDESENKEGINENVEPVNVNVEILYDDKINVVEKIRIEEDNKDQRNEDFREGNVEVYVQGNNEYNNEDIKRNYIEDKKELRGTENSDDEEKRSDSSSDSDKTDSKRSDSSDSDKSYGKKRNKAKFVPVLLQNSIELKSSASRKSSESGSSNLSSQQSNSSELKIKARPEIPILNQNKNSIKKPIPVTPNFVIPSLSRSSSKKSSNSSKNSSSSSKNSSNSSKNSSNSSKKSSNSSKKDKIIPENNKKPQTKIPNLKIPSVISPDLLSNNTNKSSKKTITINSSDSSISSSEENKELDLFTPLTFQKPQEKGLIIEVEEKVVSKKPELYEENPSNTEVIDDIVIEFNPGVIIEPPKPKEIKVEVESNRNKGMLNPEYKVDSSVKPPELLSVSKIENPKPKLLTSSRSTHCIKPIENITIKPIRPFIVSKNFKSEINLLKTPRFFKLGSNAQSFKPINLKSANKDFKEIYFNTVSTRQVPRLNEVDEEDAEHISKPKDFKHEEKKVRKVNKVKK